LIYELKARLFLAQEMLRHEVVLVNGLEHAVSQVAERLGRHYVLKIVGDIVWETARNAGLTNLSIDNFQSTPIVDPGLQRMSRRRAEYLRRARLVITPSEYLKHIVTGWSVVPNRIKVVFNGVPQDEYASFQPVRRSSELLKVAFCGRLTNWKGIETLLLAVAGLTRVKANVIGDGPELPMLEGLALQLQLMGRVQFLGRLDRQSMQTALSQSDVLVLDSLYEGLSHTLLEASAMGLAIVASESGGNPEIIESGVNGILVPYGDVTRLRTVLENLQMDEEYRYWLACNAKYNSQRFGFIDTAQHTMELLLNLK
jgi:glycosyltransferase involved in cell wall biosynthesis